MYSSSQEVGAMRLKFSFFTTRSVAASSTGCNTQDYIKPCHMRVILKADTCSLCNRPNIWRRRRLILTDSGRKWKQLRHCVPRPL